MRRSLLVLVAVVGTLLAPTASMAAVRAGIIPEVVASRHGLTRRWFTQVRLDSGLGRLQHMVLDNGTLFLQTDQAMLHAIDAATGQTLWSNQIGRRGIPSMEPGANSDLVAVVNGSYLYVVNRFNGKILWKAQTMGAPGAGPALSEMRAYVPMVDGMMASYRLKSIQDPLEELGKEEEAVLTEEQRREREEERRETIRLQQEYIPPLVCRSWGRIFIKPAVTLETGAEEFVAWATDRGYIFAARINRREEDLFPLRYRLETAAPIVAPPTYRPPEPDKPEDHGTVFAASQDGFVHAIRAHDGEPIWRFSAGSPLTEPAVYVDGRVFATTQLGGMFCLNAATGEQLWWTPGIMQFLSLSKDRVYTTDNLDRLVILSADTGSRLGALPIHGHDLRLTNLETDRIFLADETGLVQCLHEVELSEPIVYKAPPALPEAEAAAEPEEAAAEAPAEPAPADQENPFMGPPADAFPGGADDAGPFGGGAAGADENPFGDGGAGADPNPFGGGGAGAEENPFGGGGGAGADENPVGGGGGDANPFGGADAGGAGGEDPFGGGPFGNGSPF